MAALSSYTPISTQTLTADGQTVTFSSIPATYTDLVLVINATAVSTALDISMRFNSDTSSNYSRTLLMGNGTSATSARESNMTSTQINNISQISSTAAAYTGIVHIFNYANTTTFKTILSRSNNAAYGVEAVVHLWRKTPEAIHTITLTSTATRDMKIGSSFSLYGIANNTAGAKATGGVISSDSSYFYHSFYATDTFTPTQSLTCDYLVVAGGGGGGSGSNGYGGAGGGAGGLRSTVTATGGGGTLETPLSVTATAYTITVGAGGAGATNAAGTAGSNSTFSTITSTGGGQGAGVTGTVAGGTGGSGGGSFYTQNGGAGTANQGYAGGKETVANGNAGGGGGGAGAVGSNAAASQVAGAGGIGVATAISGASVYYAGGGGGGAPATGGAGGLGGGGAGGAGVVGTKGTIGTGGGGGGVGISGTPIASGAGGSGVVIIRYAR